MRTKWQSSPAYGDKADGILKGNRQNGDILVIPWEILLDLSRKFYSNYCHFFLYILMGEDFLDNGFKDNNKNAKKNGGVKENKSKNDRKWVRTIILWTILISGSVNLLSDVLLRNVNILVAFIILIFIIFLGIIFDIIGVAVTAADETPFHAKAAKKIPGAKIAVKLIRNADKVSNFCNDVIGDVCGIVSGSIGALIISKVITAVQSVNITVITALIGALVAAGTVGGKALGKSFAMNESEIIIDKVSKILYLIKKER